MAWYSTKIPKLLTKMFPQFLWHGDRNKPIIYLTFDDGPNADITPWVLDRLDEHQVKATFFCIGQNVVINPKIYSRILTEGHIVGNHTYNHLSGWKTSLQNYLTDVDLAANIIESNLFRAPYGHIGLRQTKALQKDYNIVMWDVMSGDFDQSKSSIDCTKNVLDNIKNGSIVVFHDNQKAQNNLKGSLDEIILGIKAKGFEFGIIDSKLTI